MIGRWPQTRPARAGGQLRERQERAILARSLFLDVQSPEPKGPRPLYALPCTSTGLQHNTSCRAA